MKFITTCLAVVLTGGIILAQEPPPEGPPGPRGFRGKALQEYLQLTEEQVTALRDNRRALNEAVRPLMQQIREKRQQLHEEMRSEAPDSGTVGQLNVEIKGLMEQIKALRDESRAGAVASLDGAQQAKLDELQKALELQRVAHEAAGANLLAAPEGDGFGMMMGGPGGPKGMRGPRGRHGFPGGGGPGPAPEPN